MRISVATIISSAVLIVGIIWRKNGLWLPISVAVSSIVYTGFSPWAMSNKRGTIAWLSEVIRLIINIAGFYATVGQFVCLYWLISWFAL